MSNLDLFPNEAGYHRLLKDILDNGIDSEDRTGKGTFSVFGRQIRFDLRKGFPLFTTKSLNWEAIVSELLWFIEGSGSERRLAEIRYGLDADDETLDRKKTIWTANAEAGYWKDKAKFKGDLGRVYGVQWRDWQSPDWGDANSSFPDSSQGLRTVKSIDQLTRLIEGIKRDPFDRRHLLTAWNPGELDQMALPPCHVLSQFYVRNGELSCQLYIRSNDMFLGNPFNVASYSLLTMMIAQVCGLKAAEFILTVGDAHIYKNHVEQVYTQLARSIDSEPRVTLNPEITSIDDFKMSDCVLHDYDPQEPIKAEMAV
jgi:thymidylate synthase